MARCTDARSVAYEKGPVKDWSLESPRRNFPFDIDYVHLQKIEYQ